jgi:hypothetical protein
METTQLSTKGEPRPSATFPEAELADVAGCLLSKRESQTLAQMDAAIRREVVRRQNRGRY